MQLTPFISAAVFLFIPVFGTAQSAAPGNSYNVSSETQDAVRHLIGDSILNGQAYEYVGHLADLIGPRLTGSSNYMRAAEWTEDQFKVLGLANVHTEEWTIPDTWEPGTSTGKILKPVSHQLHIYSLGWSPSTPQQGIEANIVYIPSLRPGDLDVQKLQLTGKIALIDPSSLGEKPSFSKIQSALNHLLSFPPAALLITGIANGGESLTGLTSGGTISSVPEAEIGLEDSSLIKRLLQRGPVTVRFSLANTIRKDMKIPNVIAEIPGTELPSEVVIVGAHLDSWQPGTGAQDDGAGVATVLETARAIKALDRPPRRTIRFALFGGEEEGLLGSTAYVRQHMAELSGIAAILVVDNGSAPSKGWYLMGREDEKGPVEALRPLLSGLGADGVTPDTDLIFSMDHAPFEVLGVPSLVLWNDLDKYWTLHHKASDTFDSIVKKDLTQNAAVTAVTTYSIADSKSAFAPHLSPTEVQSMLEKVSSLDDYKYLRTTGDLP